MTLWLILSGATEPPSRLNPEHETAESNSDCEEKTNYLKQIISNVKIVEHNIQWGKHTYSNTHLHNSYRNMNGKKKDGLDQIIDVFQTANKKAQTLDSSQVTIYFTGHGVKHYGNWCFKNGTIKLHDIITIANKYGKKIKQLYIYSQCCYSGNWCVDLEKYKNKCVIPSVCIKAASHPGCSAWGSNKGSTYTRWQFNNEIKYGNQMKLKYTFAMLAGNYYSIDKSTLSMDGWVGYD
eukprot:378824_1